MEKPEPSEYLSKLSHDIRTPLNAIVGLSNLLAISGLNEKQTQFVNTLKSSTNDLIALVNELVEYACKQNGSAPAQTPAAAASTPATAATTITDPAKHRILLVEDHDPNILIATTIMDSLGYPYDVARNGYDGLSLTAHNDYAVILMDVQMKGMDGLETAMQLREREKQKHAPRTPIIGLSAHTSDEYRDKCINAGMDDYMCKPLNPETFGRKIERYIQARETLLHSGNALNPVS